MFYRETGVEDDEDVNLDEFADEIDSWIIDELKGLDVILPNPFLN